MKTIGALLLALVLVGCSAYKPKRTDFYKDGKLVHSVVGRGLYEGDDQLGRYKVWASTKLDYYDIHCEKCEIKQTEIK